MLEVVVYMEIFVLQVCVDIPALTGDCSWHNEGLVLNIPRSLAEGQLLLKLKFLRCMGILSREASLPIFNIASFSIVGG